MPTESCHGDFGFVYTENVTVSRPAGLSGYCKKKKIHSFRENDKRLDILRSLKMYFNRPPDI